MTNYLQIALEAANFIAAQRLAGRAKWRRADDGPASD
jgi:hypothetical protein